MSIFDTVSHMWLWQAPVQFTWAMEQVGGAKAERLIRTPKNVPERGDSGTFVGGAEQPFGLDTVNLFRAHSTAHLKCTISHQTPLVGRLIDRRHYT